MFFKFPAELSPLTYGMDSDRVALAGTIGTWAAVLIALLALVAVFGPILVWAAARTERNKALHAAGEATQSFIGPGLHFVGFDVRLLRRVRAPIIDKAPENLVLTFDIGRYTETKSRATWVQFANLLLGHGAEFPRGDNLSIYRGKAILPVHRICIMLVGLTGRYSAESARKTRRGFSMSTPRVQFEEGGPPNDDDVSAPWTVRRELNGLTGQLRVSEKVPGLGFSDSSIVQFSPRPALELTTYFAQDRLPPHDLFMLAIGCLPVSSGRYLSLVDLWSSEEVQHSETSELVPLPEGDRVLGSAFRRLQSVGTVIARSGSRSGSTGSSGQRPGPGQRQSSLFRAQMQLLESDKPVALKLEKVDHWDAEIERMKAPFRSDPVELYALEVQAPDPMLYANLRSRMAATFVEPSFEYIRLSKPIDDTSDKLNNIFVWRPDAQKLAHGLLTLPWHPQGYLIGGDSTATAIRLLEYSARDFLYLLTRARENLNSLVLDPGLRPQLKDRCDDVDKSVRREQSGVILSTFQPFHALDGLLAQSSHADNTVNEMISVLMITNEEFASFVRQSARHFDKSIAGSIDVALETGFVQVKLPFGGVQDFPVDLRELYANWVRRAETITVNYTPMILACLRATMRSYLVQVRMDGHPLIKEIMQMDDTVYMA
ncbi:hypothetical protein QBC34DRAFT_406558 [Podospora aff. communis PSN243]|uniref:Uncharacterized protein n=1 Tax=Podospora aff. communis PSN243 TaxID=3040156 RepID=A0AAV9GLQ9_9PEZI|nr:hypothetical protein QBC34DRAFT_406558 [Podospora aff. communis PSN243]